MRAVVRPASVATRTASQDVMSKRGAAPSSDQEVMRHLSRSQIFKDYECAFSEAMGLPLNIRGTIPGRRRTMEKRITTHSPQFWLVSTRLAPHAYGPKPKHLENRTRQRA